MQVRKKKGYMLDIVKKSLILGIVLSSLFSCCFSLNQAQAEELPKAKLLMSPAAGSFLVGSTFDVSVIVDTNGGSINTVKVDLSFPPDKLQIVTPSTGYSFISLWLEQPSYSNIRGTISYAGGTPGGIKTSSGIVSTISFRAVKAGEAVISVLPSSDVLAHDGKGTSVLGEKMNGRYLILPRPPDGPKVFSTTHPDETRWYNNDSPIVSWERELSVTNFSYELDNFPQTVPDNISEGQETTKSYEIMSDGLNYFHIKAQKEGPLIRGVREAVWGAPTHFVLRIDTTPPASFTPKVEFLLAAIISRAFVSFTSTDALSGIDHYEIAVIDREQPPLNSPIFIEAESPYQLPSISSGHSRILVRAVDKAGNIREEAISVDFPESFLVLLKSKIVIIISIILTLIFILIITRLLFKKKEERESSNQNRGSSSFNQPQPRF